MKNIQLKKYLVAAALLVFSIQGSFAQQYDRSSIKELVQSKNFVFSAQSASPMRGGIRQLSSVYDIQFLGDTVVSYLPYFGRAYTAPVSADDAGIQFTSTNFTYNTVEKDNGWEVTIMPKDTRNVRKMYLSISEDGYASLQVLSNHRESISFRGYLHAPDDGK
jgi:hypothetical protein